MHNVDSYLKLSYSPLTLYEFDMFRSDKDIYGDLLNCCLYVIAKRPLPIMKLTNSAPNGLTFSITDETGIEKMEMVFRTDDNTRFFNETDISQIQTFSNLIDKSDYFHAITLYRNKNGSDDFAMHANFDRLIHLASNKYINISYKGNLNYFVNYEVLYVGQCTGEHIYKRFKTHHALLDILIKENIIPKSYDKINDLVILPFYISSDVVSVIDGNATEHEFIEAMTGKFNFGDKEIALDCEKALIKAMTPKYNKTCFKNYPNSKDGLYNHNIDSYHYRILENLILKYPSDNEIYGDVLLEKASVISVFNDSDFIINK